jgi:hypothetical protein
MGESLLAAVSQLGLRVALLSLARELLDERPQFAQRKRFGKYPCRTVLHEVGLSVVTWLAAHETANDRGIELLQGGQRLQAVAARHAHVEDYQDRLPAVLLIEFQRLVATGRLPDGESLALEHHFQETSHGWLVVGNQDARFPLLDGRCS